MPHKHLWIVIAYETEMPVAWLCPICMVIRQPRFQGETMIITPGVEP